MKRYLFAFVMLLCCVMNVSAQSSFTDEQVIRFIMKEQQDGTSQQQIATKLIQKGVTVEQLRRVQKKAERLKNNQGLGAIGGKTMGTDQLTRTRKAEDYVRDQNNSTKLLKVEQAKKDNLNKNRRETLNDPDEVMEMKGTIDEFMPDSFDIYDQQVIREYLKARDEYEKKAKREIFGHSMFDNDALTFEPAMNIATPSDYVLGAGDAVFIDIYGASQKTIQETVSPDGYVVVEDFGPIQVAGLTVSQANNRVKSQLGGRYSSSKIRLSVGQTRTITVNVMGEVKAPGTYTLSAFATVFHALYMAGGPNDIGTLRNIKVYRNNRLISTVDVYDYILNGKLSGNVRLTDNDVISVGAYDCLVNMTGKVKRPMFYEMKKGESISSAIKYAGGFTGDAYRKAVRVVRKAGSQFSVYNVGEFDMSSFHMADEDSVSVDSVLPRYSNMVEIKGAVFRPGMYQLGGNINSVKSLIEQAEGVTEEAFTHHAVMHRMKADRTLEVIQVDIAGIMNGTAADIALQNEDVLFVATRQDVNAEQTITIYGEVMYPGVYQYANNETIEDFVIQAGGLKASASMVNVFVSRRTSNPFAVESDTTLAQTFNFKLKDGFVIDGESGFHLMPFDEVYVRRSPGYNEQKNVTIDGEILFRGQYTLTRKNERLSDLVKKAGGFTDLAYVAGARLERKMNDAERLRYLESARMQRKQDETTLMEQAMRSGRSLSELRAGSSRDYTTDINSIPETYQVGIELDKAMEKPGSDYDIVLREGDNLVIPSHNGTVKINGEVMYPNTVGFEAGKKAKYYINQAGGYSSKAKKSRTYIIYMNGDVARVKRSTKVTPGSEIVVPAKSINKMTTAETVTLGSGIASIATMIATLANILTR